MANISDVHTLLSELRTDWRNTNTELCRLIENSSDALARVDSHLGKRKSIFSSGVFWLTIGQLVVFGVLLSLALFSGECLFQAKGILSLNCGVEPVVVEPLITPAF